MRPGIWEVKAGDIVGELAAFDDRPRAASVVGVADGEAIAIDGVALRRFLDEHPELGYGVLREILTSLVERLRASNQRLETVFAWGLRARGIDRHL
jgi:CRP-like cAMP-binding protein